MFNESTYKGKEEGRGIEGLPQPAHRIKGKAGCVAKFSVG